MSKIAVVYWSGTGNTKEMAEAVFQGAQSAGAEVTLLETMDFHADMISSYDAIAFGCPSMGVEVLEENEFEPMFASVEASLAGKKIGLFGSWGWGGGEWMTIWYERCLNDGAQVVNQGVTCNGAPDENALEECRNLGASLN